MQFVLLIYQGTTPIHRSLVPTAGRPLASRTTADLRAELNKTPSVTSGLPTAVHTTQGLS